ncbi:MAG: chemotaxis protein CheA [Herminiimonas sp.]|nr:chemotaxis protein CheA [Herminiimonas sp.]
MSDDAHLYDDALATFFAEAREMLQQIEDCLLILETDPADQETINTLFRAAHTIKGSAGLFGLDQVVRATHQVESVLDRVRNVELRIDGALSDRLLKSADLIAALLEHAATGNGDTAATVVLEARTATMTKELAAYCDLKPAASPVAQAAAVERDNSAGTWHLSLRFGIDTFRNGFDPLSVVRYLGTVGELANVKVVVDDIPALEDLDPESCHLGFELDLRTTADQAAIEAAFDFVRDDCVMQLLPPARPAADFVEAMAALPDESRIGDLLVESGAVSVETLNAALMRQHQEQASAAEMMTPPRRLGEILVAEGKVASTVVDAALSKQRKHEQRQEEARFVRVPADKLDELINLVGELVICGAGAAVLAQGLRSPTMTETLQQMSGLVEEIRNGTLGLRMVQIGELFARYRRVVRDTAVELGKAITLEIEGAETELDKAVVEKISDPLMHLVRNAMDHGIESPAARVAAGKPAAGTVRLAAHHDSGHIVIRVSDDGHGLDGERLEAKARARGLIAPNLVLSEADRLQLIFEPGLSTAEAVTNLSGRGVGMDVVRRNIEALRGSIVLDSEPGEGTTIEIRLPLTLAIIDGFLVRVGSSSYVIPLHAVVECIDAPADQLQANGDWAGHLRLRGDVLPYLELRQVFGVTDKPPVRRSVVVVKQGNALAGLVVDQLMGEYQTVIKPLGKLFHMLRGISGSTVMGTGEVALILDVPALVKLAIEHESHDLPTALREKSAPAARIETVGA